MYWPLLFLTILCLAYVQRIDTADESFFLQVANRIASGEILYRDVFLGTTPLSAYILALSIKLFSCDIAIARTLLAIYLFLTLFLLDKIFQHYGIPYRKMWIVMVLACVHYEGTLASSAYTSLSYLFFLSSFYCLLIHRIPLAAISAALCFLSKQNVGVFLIAALIAVLTKERRWKEIAVVLGIAGAVSLLVLMIPFLQGAGADMAIHCFKKGRYISLGNQTPFAEQYWIIYCISLLAIFALLSQFRFSLAVFYLAALLSVFPRFDPAHLTFVLPFAFLILLTTPPLPQMNFIFMSCSVFAIGITFYSSIHRLQIGVFKWADLPHFHVGIIDSDSYYHYQAMSQELQHQKDLCFLSPKAGFYYLITNSQNPTPFDYPIYPALKWSSERKIIQLLQGMRVLEEYSSLPLREEILPQRVRQYLRRELTPSPTTYPLENFCYFSSKNT